MIMEVKKESNDTTKTVVPIKGALMEKLKAQILAKKEPQTKRQDTLNNNNNHGNDTILKKEKKEAEKKVIIQSIEKVQIDLTSMLPSKTLLDHADYVSPSPKVEPPQAERSTVKILKAKMPENECNKSVPLKVTRVIKPPPRPVPVVNRHRIGNVLIHKSSPPTIPAVKSAKTEEFKGFSSKEPDPVLEQINSIRQSVMMTDSTDTSELPSTLTSQVITDSMVDSSMMREFASALEPTTATNSDSSDFDDEMEDTSDEIDSEMDADQEEWLMDIEDLLGENRIREIDQSLKKIPSIAQGNKTETENVELKLIINHLLKKLNAQTVAETLRSNKPIANESITVNAAQESSVSEVTKCESAHVPVISEVSTQNPKANQEDYDDMYDDHNSEMDIGEETIQEPPQIMEQSQEAADEETPKEVHVVSSRKRKNELYPLATSTAKKMKPKSNYGLIDINIGSPSTADDSVISSRVRSRLRKENEVSSNDVVQENNKRARNRPERFDSVPSSSSSNVEDVQVVRRYSKIVSENDVVSEKSLCKNELKSNENDLNSPASTVIVYEDYLNSSSSSPPLDKREKNLVVDKKSNPIIQKVQTVVNQQKAVDATFRKPKLLKKREYLRTSAFKGNQNDIKQETLEEEPCSYSNDSIGDSNSVSNEPYASQLPTLEDNEREEEESEDVKPNVDQQERLKEAMNSLIEGKDRIFSKPTKKPSVPRKKVKKKVPTKPVQSSQRRSFSRKCSKKVFIQEPLEPADESLVPYMQIIESIKISEPLRGKKSGKVIWKAPEMSEEKMHEWRKKLVDAEYFQCGCCMFKVTKHKWKEHLESHGMFAFIEGYEAPLNILDWHESLRRMIHYCRIYKIENITCPHCGSVKKSPLGQMAHFYTCGEDDEAIEERKKPCESCGERILPPNMSAHKRACKGPRNKPKILHEETASENEEEKEVTLSGRVKRKAVKKAEKNFVSLIKTLNEDGSDHVGTTDENESVCNLCGEKFTTKELALEHIEEVHNVQKRNEDFGSSSSDDYGAKSDESSETDDESSGVDENEQSSDNCGDENDNDSDSKIVSFAFKGRKSTTETDECRRAREVLYDYIEELRNKKLAPTIEKLQKELLEITHHDEIFSNLVPNFNVTMMDLATFFSNLRFRQNSVNYFTNQVNRYLMDFEDTEVNGNWKQLSIGARDIDDSHHIFIFCGGSVSCTDWAPTNDEDLNFLAVSCNPNDTGLKHGLEERMKSCVQIYEFNSLVNRGFQNFRNIHSHLLYVFNINDGPIWSIKFHPCGHPTENRIGILAVTTAIQRVNIYSLPYLNKNHESPLVLTLEPNIICDLTEEPMMYQENFLLQTTRICWHYQKDSTNTLIAGYVDGLVAFWNFDEETLENAVTYPNMVIKAHSEAIAVLDTKVGNRGQIILLTSSNGREVKLYSIEKGQYEEIMMTQPTSRTLCAQLWAHWPAFLIGNDSAYALGSLISRQPFDFGTKNTMIVQTGPSIIAMDINQWTSTVIFSTESGDIVAATVHQLVKTDPKDRWTAFQSTILSFTDFKRVPQEGNVPDEIGIVFSDMKSNGNKRPKNFRTPPVELTNQLQINQICFNRNEKSHRFYALSYETGFVRVRFAKNS